jgi:serine protease AprX
MAAPHVAGTAALVQSATTVDLGVDELERALFESATPLAEEEGDNRYGHGAVDAVAAIERAGDYGAVEGTVTDSQNGTPLEHASVTVAGDDVNRETTTDAEGEFELSGIHGDRTYDVRVDHENYERTTDPAFIVADETTTVDRSIDGDAAIAVSLADEQFDEGIETATVTAKGSGGEYSGTHLGDGTYRIETVPSDGEYELRIRAPGYADHEESRSIETAGEADTAVELSGDSTLEISAETDEEAPVENASASVTSESGGTIEPRDRTDDEGRLELKVPGTDEGYVVDVSASSHESATGDSGAVKAGSSTTVSVTFPAESAPTRLPRVGVLAAAFAALSVRLVRLVRE